MTHTSQPSSNVFLFYGEDSFSLQRKIEHWKKEFAKKYSASAVTVVEAGELPETEIIKNLQIHLAPSLFTTKRLIIIRDGLPSKATQTTLAEFLLKAVDSTPKDFFVIFWQTKKPDGRLGFNKNFAAKVTVNEFSLPKGLMLNQWIKAMAKTLNVSITDRGADKLAQFSGRDIFEEKNVKYNLWEVHSSLLKLASLNTNIDTTEVENLVTPKVPDSVFVLTEQLIAQNQRGAMNALENFLAGQTADEKTSFIKIIALLSEQIRSLLVVSLLVEEGLNNDEIAQKLDWSSARVFVTMKNIRNVSAPKLKQLLKHLLLLDSRIKSIESNHKLDLDLFLVKATS